MEVPPGVVSGRAGVEAHVAAVDLDAVGGEVGVETGVGELVDGVAEDGGLAGSAAERELGRRGYRSGP